MANEEPTKEKMKLPVIHDSCPVCHSKKRLGATIIQQLKDEGLLHKDAFSKAFVYQVPLLDQQHPPAIIAKQFTIKVVLIYFDVCECGEMYCTDFELVDAPAVMEINRQPGFPPRMR